MQNRLSHSRFLSSLLMLCLLVLSGCTEEAAAGVLAGGITLWLIFSVLLVILVIWALVDLWKKPYPTEKKLIWVLVILIIPYIGAILYFLIGRRSRNSVV